MPTSLPHLVSLLLLNTILNGQPSLSNELPTENNPLALPNLPGLIEQALPSVVNLQVELQQPSHPLLETSPHRFQPHGLATEGGKELGSGIVVHEKGLVLTNYHLVEHARHIDVEIWLPQGKWLVRTADILQVAPEFDLALLQIQHPPPVRSMPLGDSEALRIGEQVIAIGNPFGFKHSVALGILSGRGRQIAGPEGKPDLYQLLQTDTAINPGNSGGPLLNRQGACIGLNTAIHTAGQGLGFAIASNTIQHILSFWLEQRPLQRTWFGVQLQNMTASLATSYGRDDLEGALVIYVHPKSPAAQAGLEEEDILLQFDRHSIAHLGDVRFWASLARAHQPIPIQIWRKGQLLERQVRLENKPLEPIPQRPTPDNKHEGPLGFVVTELTPEVLQSLALPPTQGALIKQVTPYSPAAHAGLLQGDIVIGTSQGPIAHPQQLSRWLQQQPSGKWLRFKLLRNGNPYYVAMRKPEKPVNP